MKYVHRFKNGDKVNLNNFDPDQHSNLSREKCLELTHKLGMELAELHELMYAAADTSLLIVLQGRDTAGKDGSIRHLTTYLNAQSCKVQSFKVPTEEEQAHDFLWRIHPHVPRSGYVSIFNRSHYEDVLITRVHKMVSDSIIDRRYSHINEFEKLLTDKGTLVLKFCLFISKDEQEERLIDREQDPSKSYKLSVADWKEREYWDDYTSAYEQILQRCNPDSAPFYIVAANHKWYRDLAITDTIVQTLQPMRATWEEDLKKRGAVAMKELEDFRKGSSGR